MFTILTIGSSIGVCNGINVVINVDQKRAYMAQPGCQEWVTVIECICHGCGGNRWQPVATGSNRWQPGPYWSHMGYGEDAWATGKLHGTWRGCLEHDEASWTMSRWQRPGVRVRMESRGLGPVPREYRQFADIKFFLSLQHRPSRLKTGPRPQPVPDSR